MRNVLVALVLGLALSPAAVGCRGAGDDDKPAPSVPVSVATAVIKDVPLRLEAIARSLDMSPMPIREAVRELDPRRPVGDVRMLEGVVGRAIGGRRFQVSVLGAFAAVAQPDPQDVFAALDIDTDGTPQRLVELRHVDEGGLGQAVVAEAHRRAGRLAV